MFGGRYSFDGLATWARMIRHGHGAGLPLARVFEMQAKNGPLALRPAASLTIISAAAIMVSMGSDGATASPLSFPSPASSKSAT